LSIGEIKGIENLKPRKPIIFGEGNLNVIYGYNGSGKSGIVRIIKAACGMRLKMAFNRNFGISNCMKKAFRQSDWS